MYHKFSRQIFNNQSDEDKFAFPKDVPFVQSQFQQSWDTVNSKNTLIYKSCSNLYWMEYRFLALLAWLSKKADAFAFCFLVKHRVRH